MLVTVRIIQGLSVCGEYTSSLIFLEENAPQNRRAFNAIWGVWGATAGAWLADLFGRKPLLIAGSMLITGGSIPLFHLIHAADPKIIFGGEVGFAVTIGLVAGGHVTTSVELIPSPVRCTGPAFAYNASVGWFGGTPPLTAAWLITITGNPIMPAYWITLAGAITLLTAIFLVPETTRESWNTAGQPIS